MSRESEILVIGAGIGGLTLALTLHGRGFCCRLFEAAPEFRPLGVGINMLPHAIRELSALGLQSSLGAYGVEAREFAYFNRHGQAVFTEQCGRFAGYEHPHFSIHRADLHKVLLDAVLERLGPDAVRLGHCCVGVEQDAEGVTARFDGVESVVGSIAIAADGFHSAVRRQFHPSEGAPHFGGINMWRGVTRRKPFLTGASVTRIGTVARGKMVIYPIRQFGDGTQLINWNTEQPRADRKPNDWATPGRMEDFTEPFADWRFDWLDVPALIADAEFILEYPMVDRQPMDLRPRHAARGRGAPDVSARRQRRRPGHSRRRSAGAAARRVRRSESGVAPYEDERLGPTSEIVLTNRDQPPDYIIETVDALTGGERFERIDDVIDPAELAAISDRYKDIAGYSLGTAKR